MNESVYTPPLSDAARARAIARDPARYGTADWLWAAEHGSAEAVKELKAMLAFWRKRQAW